MSKGYELLREQFIRTILEELENDDGSDSDITIIPTDNPEHGFYGQLKEIGIAEDMIPFYWDEMSSHLQNVGKLSAEDTRAFLDSRGGRKLANDLNEKEALEKDLFKHSLITLLPEPEIKKWFEFYNS